jgi:hypothetical protein
MNCPVCGETDKKTINVRVKQESDLKQLAGSTWDGRNMARCNECGVLYDHRYANERDDGTGSEVAETVNCPDCGSPNPGDRETCSYCGTSLDRSSVE